MSSNYVGQKWCVLIAGQLTEDIFPRTCRLRQPGYEASGTTRGFRYVNELLWKVCSLVVLQKWHLKSAIENKKLPKIVQLALAASAVFGQSRFKN